MKLKHGIILLAVGYCFDFVGTWMKITHQLYADQLIGLATLLKVIAVIIIGIKLIKNPRLKDLINQ